MRSLPTALGIATAIAIVAGTASAGQRIDLLQGGVSAENVERFAEAISDRLDKIVGLKIYVDTGGSDGMSASADGGMFVLYKSGGDFEIVANGGYRYEHGGYVFDGYFLVKSGGMHQGVVSFGLEEVDEAQVLLTPGIEIIPVPLQ